MSRQFSIILYKVITPLCAFVRACYITVRPTRSVQDVRFFAPKPYAVLREGEKRISAKQS